MGSNVTGAHVNDAATWRGMVDKRNGRSVSNVTCVLVSGALTRPLPSPATLVPLSPAAASASPASNPCPFVPSSPSIIRLLIPLFLTLIVPPVRADHRTGVCVVANLAGTITEPTHTPNYAVLPNGPHIDTSFCVGVPIGDVEKKTWQGKPLEDSRLRNATVSPPNFAGETIVETPAFAWNPVQLPRLRNHDPGEETAEKSVDERFISSARAARDVAVDVFDDLDGSRGPPAKTPATRRALSVTFIISITMAICRAAAGGREVGLASGGARGHRDTA